jgi:hypothetical protein
MEDVLFFYYIFKNSKKTIYTAVPYYNYVSNDGSVTRQFGLTEAAQTALSVLNFIAFVEQDKKIKQTVKLALTIFEKNLCIHYIKMKEINSQYYLLRKDIKNKFLSLLVDFSFPIKEKLLTCMTLYPKLFNFISVLYKIQC